MVASVAALVTAAFVTDSEPGPPIGRLSEPQGALPPAVPMAHLVEATKLFGITDSVGGDFSNPMAGGVAADDLNSDGRIDFVVAHGAVMVFRSTTGGFDPPVTLDIDDAVSVTAADVDLDGWPDLLIARSGDEDSIVWGGDWLDTGFEPESTELPGAGPSSQLMAGELSGDDRVDLVRLGSSRGPSDVIWVSVPGVSRRFDRVELPAGDRISLTGELADVDGDGLLDIWINRDVGWDIGPDALFSRLGDSTGPWIDVASDLGAALRIDSMGLTLADLDGDGTLDAYVSDLGDNEVLLSGDDGFSARSSTGAARIRPPGSEQSIVSSSWASGATDINLDGILDLVVVNGGFPDGGVRNKIPATSVAVVDPPAILLGSGHGTFTDVWPDLGLGWSTASRGMAIADLDLDGDDDVVVVGVGGSITILRNDAEGPSLSVAVSSKCITAGMVLSVEASAQTKAAGSTFKRLLAPHSFGGSHSPVAVVGAADGSQLDVTIANANGATASRSAVVNSRTRVAIECPR